MGLLNEPAGFIIGGDKVKDFYKQAYDTFRKATGPAKGPWAIFHDGFLGHSSFSGFLAGSDRVMLDLHQYIMFNVDLMNFNQTKQLDFACSDWAFLTNYFKAQVEAFERGIGWFYWNFKTESNPLWSYFDGVDNGWLPKDANNRGPNFCKF
ncbi:hypothetical protein BGW38_009716 [Lunasporangiospora selenospora]|uniref:glucan 1,3-beta-glucosidase n=1 Tax=Lunasporangiospora selenospora TaxID=979761 RepID=A0A9P6F8C7_9FUNG|nr:hypothetical protein BGW38_009716 [Lunasporangiospora selenospora]